MEAGITFWLTYCHRTLAMRLKDAEIRFVCKTSFILPINLID
jgi:hypothetical protein